MHVQFPTLIVCCEFFFFFLSLLKGESQTEFLHDPPQNFSNYLLIFFSLLGAGKVLSLRVLNCDVSLESLLCAWTGFLMCSEDFFFHWKDEEKIIHFLTVDYLNLFLSANYLM